MNIQVVPADSLATSSKTARPKGQTWQVSKNGLPEALNLNDQITIQRSHQAAGPQWSQKETWLYQVPDYEPAGDEACKVAISSMPLTMAIKRAIDEDTDVMPLNCNGCGSSGYIKIVSIFRPAKKATKH